DARDVLGLGAPEGGRRERAHYELHAVLRADARAPIAETRTRSSLFPRALRRDDQPRRYGTRETPSSITPARAFASPSSSGTRTSRCARAATATSRTSSGVTNVRPFKSAIPRATVASESDARGDAPR